MFSQNRQPYRKPSSIGTLFWKVTARLFISVFV